MIKKLWQKHGTKLLGIATTIVGVIPMFTAELQAVLPAGAIKWYNLGVALLGMFVVKRGFTNTRNANAPELDPGP